MSPCSRFRNSFFSALIFSGLIVVLCAAPPAAGGQTPPPASHQQRVPPPGPKPQEQFVVYWTTEAGWNTELLLRNNLDSAPLAVTPAVRTANGTETALPAVSIQPGEVASLDLSETLVKSAPQLEGAWGSLALRYQSATRGALYASVMVRATNRPISFHLDAEGRGTKYEVGSREGIWWLPWASTTGVLVLANSGDQPLSSNLILYDSGGHAWQRRLTLAPRETQRLAVRALVDQAGFAGFFGGIKLDMGQGARYLDSAHLLFEDSGRFSALMKMFRHDPSITFSSRSFGGVSQWTTRAPMLALSNPDPALAFPAGTTLHPKVFIRNTTNRALVAQLRFDWRSAAASGKSAPLNLSFKPNETQVVDVAALQSQNFLPLAANWAAIILSAPVQPDDLLAVAASYDLTGRYGAQTPFSDQLATHWEGGKWEVDGTHDSLVTILNGGNTPALAELTILYNQGAGKYQIQQPLGPDQQFAVDFGKLIHNQIADRSGHVLPANLASGAYRLRDLNDNPTGSLYEGKVITDTTFGNVTYGCMICCGPDSPFMIYDPIDIPIDGFGDQGVQAINSCSNRLVTITGDFPTWWTDNASVATANGYQINGVAVGSTNNNALSINMYWGPKEDSGGEACPVSQAQPVGPVNVKPTISGSSTVWFFGNLTVSGYTTSLQLTSSGGSSTTWNITAGGDKITVSSFTGSSINVLSSGTAFSSTTGDVKITATANGLTSDPFPITTRTPNVAIQGTITITCDSAYGYLTDLEYAIQDQMSTSLPSGVPVNENWTTGVASDYNGTNWRRGDPNGVNEPVSAFADQIQGEAFSLPAYPTPTCDGNSTPVEHWGQEWRVGSLASGFGRRIQTDTIQKYIGHAVHASIVSPAP